MSADKLLLSTGVMMFSWMVSEWRTSGVLPSAFRESNGAWKAFWTVPEKGADGLSGAENVWVLQG
jgi:hypothetical protein